MSSKYPIQIFSIGPKASLPPVVAVIPSLPTLGMRRSRFLVLSFHLRPLVLVLHLLPARLALLTLLPVRLALLNLPGGLYRLYLAALLLFLLHLARRILLLLILLRRHSHLLLHLVWPLLLGRLGLLFQLLIALLLLVLPVQLLVSLHLRPLLVIHPPGIP